MRRFRLALFAFTLLGHLPFAAGLAYGLGRLDVPFAGWIAGVIAAALVAAFAARLRRFRSDRRMSPMRVWLLEEPYFAHWCATALSWPLLLIAGPAAAIVGEGPGAAALWAYGAAFAACLYGVLVRRRWVRVRQIEVPVAGLGAAFDGYRIAQLSDLHIGGLWSRARAERWIAKTNALDVDLVALTGDYVTHGDDFHEDIAAVLASFRGRDGSVAVMGNHDYFGDGEALVELLRARGLVVLRNEHRTLTRGGDALTLTGVDDVWSRRADVALALAGREEGPPVIALAHDPSLFPALARRGVALTLSGHTHWGQIAVPFLARRLNLTALNSRYHAGVYREGASTLYVSPGLGTTGPPIRIGVPPEITVVTLRAA